MRDYTQEHVASELNISQNAYSRIESGQTKIDVERLKQIARILRIDPATLIAEDEKSVMGELQHSNEETDDQSLSITRRERAFLEQRFRAIEDDIKFMRYLFLGREESPNKK